MKEDQLREDQRREALARLAEPASEEPLLPPAAPRIEEPAPAPAPRYEQPPAQERRAEQPRIDPKVLLENDGLVMIETDRSKAPPPPVVEVPQQHLGRPRRERQKPMTPQEEELQQVETRK
jgi:hypothetical protein